MRNRKKTRRKRSKSIQETTPSNLINANKVDNKALQKDNPLKVVSQQMSFSGPIPHPALLEKYDQIIPKGADRILAMAEKQSIHRQYIEKWSIIGGTILSYLGVFCACAIAIIVSYYGYSLVRAGHAISGTIFSGVGLIGLVSAFIYGTRSRKEERLKKYQSNK